MYIKGISQIALFNSNYYGFYMLFMMACELIVIISVSFDVEFHSISEILTSWDRVGIYNIFVVFILIKFNM